MEREQYELMYRQEAHHWWYAGMRRISAALLDRFPPRVDDARRGPFGILDAGCGSGGTTRFLESYGRVTGIDVAPEATRLARRRGIDRLLQGSVTELPFRPATFDIVTSFDVLYHLGVRNDRAALEELYRVLRPGGVLLIRVPAYDWIRGAHDQAVHTRHRYTREELTRKLRAVGFEVETASYANSILFPVAPAKRFLERRWGHPLGTGHGAPVIDLWRPPRPINRLLTDLLALESQVVVRTGFPWGLSVFAVARRPDTAVQSAVSDTAVEVAAIR